MGETHREALVGLGTTAVLVAVLWIKVARTLKEEEVRMKRSMAACHLLVIVSFIVAACGGTPAPTGPTKITWWHAMGGTNGDAINNLTG